MISLSDFYVACPVGNEIPSCMPAYAHYKLRRQVANKLTLIAGFKNFFDDVFQYSTLLTQIGNHLLQTIFLILEIFDF